MSKDSVWKFVGDPVRWSVNGPPWEWVHDGSVEDSVRFSVRESVQTSVEELAVDMVKWSIHNSLEEAIDE